MISKNSNFVFSDAHSTKYMKIVNTMIAVRVHNTNYSVFRVIDVQWYKGQFSVQELSELYTQIYSMYNLSYL